MTGSPNSSSGSYAYYSFPPTPNRSSPAASSRAGTTSRRSSRGTTSSTGSRTPRGSQTPTPMAPSPAAGRAPKLPSTPTKSGKNPASSSTPKLGQAGDQAKTASNTPQSTAKGATDKAKNTASKGTSSPKLPPRPKAGEEATDKAKDAASEVTENVPGGDDVKDKAEEATQKATGDDEDTPQGKISQTGADTDADESGKDLEEAAPEPIDDDEDEAAEGAKETADDAEEAAGDAGDEAEEGADEATGGITGGLKKGVQSAAGAAGKATGKVTGQGSDDQEEDQSEALRKISDGDFRKTAQDTAEDVQEGAEDATGAVKDTAEEAADGVQDAAGEAAEGAKDTAGKATEGAEDVAGEAKDTAENTAEGAKDQLPDISILKGLEVGEGGEILDKEGNPVGKIEEGDPADLVGQTIGDDGEILDEDGDVIGRASVLPDKVKDTAEEAAETYLPDLDILKGLEVQENGDILDKEGNVVGKITEGDPEQLAGQVLNEEGEVLDEDGDAIGRAETIPQPIKEAVDEAQENVPDVGVLDGLKVGDEGEILDKEGNPIGKLTEGDAKDLAGKTINEKGEVIGEDGEVLGKAEAIAQDAADEAKQNIPDNSALEGLEVGEGGDIIGPDGNVLGRITEGNPEDLVGQKLNDKGEVLDDDGDAIGRAEVVPQEAKDAVDGLKPDFSILQGKKVNKKGNILDEEGETLAKLTEDSDLKKCAGKTPNEKGEILDDNGEVIGRVEIVEGEAADEAMKALHPELVEEKADEVKNAAEEAAPDFSIVDGLKVNKKGEVLNEDGEPIAKLAEGELADCAGKKINENGEVLDKEGNVIGKVELIPQEGEGEGEEGEQEETGPELPPLSILEGRTCNKAGYIVDEEGNPIGKLVEGDAKQLSKSKAECDDQGQFWDGKGHVIGRAETIPQEDKTGEDAPFAGLEGLIVVKDGWVEDENGNRVGQLTEGDPKKLVGRHVDEDGDVIDKRGNVVGHAERWEEEEAPEEEGPDLSVLKGLTVNKQGNVIGPDGVPIAKLVEGNPKELAGKKCDENGQIWNDQGKVIGRCELIPEDQREAKPEGPFAGLEGLVVVKGGMVHDEDGNVVGQVTEGDPKKLVGRAVDEDGDIIDKYGNVKGHAEPYEEPEEEETDLSSLEGKTVNKVGNVVDAQGNVFGRIASGDPKKLAGRKVDGKGQIWSDDGKVIGQAELIPGGEQEAKAEGPFAGFENLVVAKDGLIKDGADQIVGRIIEGDAKKLLGRKVDEDGDILDRNGNTLGKAERWEPEEKKREVNPMSGRKVNKDGEVRDANGDLIGRLTAGNLGTCVGKEIDDNGYVVDNDGNKIGECTLLENIQEEEEEEGPTEEELQKQQDAQIAKKMSYILKETLDKVTPICQQITEKIEKADRTPKDELDEQKLVDEIKPLLEDGGKILQECNGSIRALDPDGSIAANAKQRAASGEATKEEHQLAELLKELTSTVVKTIDNGKKRISGMPHAKKKLNPLWGLLSEPLFQIIAAVGLLLAGVLGLVGRLLNGLGLGGLVNGLLGGLGIDKLLGGLGLGSLTEAITGKK